ncbi:MAG: CvpA family protein [Ruminococcaceae bacterium]|jgi:uncharacterized membrane protein required for colicin V production|nr:CvpA family protein [Oscillospiraceae bacterium]
MELAIDAILIFAAVFCIWAGTRRGFVRSVMGLINTAVSALAAYAFTPTLAPFFEEKFLAGRMVSDIEGILHASLDTTTDLFDLDATLANLPGWFTDLLDRYHVSVDSVSEVMRGITGADGTSLRNLSERLAYPTASALAHAVSFALIFIGAFLVMSILTAILDAVFRMPVLNSANMFFGFLVGAVEGLVLVSVLALVLDAGVRALGAFDPSWFGDKAVDNTILCRFLVEHNPLAFLTQVLK